MKKFYKIMALVMSMILMVALFAGCGEDVENVAETDEQVVTTETVKENTKSKTTAGSYEEELEAVKNKYSSLPNPETITSTDEFLLAYKEFADSYDEAIDLCEKYPDKVTAFGAAGNYLTNSRKWSGQVDILGETIADRKGQITFLEACLEIMERNMANDDKVIEGLEKIKSSLE